MFKIRTSKFRHVFCDQPKPQEIWTEFRLSTVTGDQQYIKASAKFFAVGMAGGGGPMIVMDLNRPGRFDNSASPFLSGHSGAVNDMDWSPFDDHMLATASEDTTIKIWQIPQDWEPIDEQGNAKAGKEMKESVADLIGHRKKVTLLSYHPTASNTLMSTSGDYTVKIWDVQSAKPVSSYGDSSDLVHDITWDDNGETAAASCKDKAIRFFDPRAGQAVATIPSAHEGAKSIKTVYVGDSAHMFSFGANKQSAREIKVWDLKDLSKPVHVEAVDTAAGAMIPLYDKDTSVLYLCGKGDGIIRVYEYEDKSPFIFKLNEGFRSNIPGKGYCMVPKRGLKIMNCEAVRIMKVTNNEGVHPLSFIVPRKSDAFQDDIFPPTASAVPAHTHQEWFAGSCKGVVKMSLDPKDGGKAIADNGGSAAAPKKAFKTAAQLQIELDAANKRIAALESGGGGGGASNVVDDGASKRVAELEAKLAADGEAAKVRIAELEAMVAGGDAAQARITELEAMVAGGEASQARITELEAKVAEGEASQTRIAELEAKLKEHSIEF